MRRIFIYFLNVILAAHTVYYVVYIHVYVQFDMVYFYYNVDDDKFMSHIKNSIQ